MRASCARATIAPSSTSGRGAEPRAGGGLRPAVAATAALFAFMRSYTGKPMRDCAGPLRRPAHGNRHGPHLRAHLGGRHCLRRGGRRAARADLPGLPHGGAAVRPDRLYRRRARRSRRHGRSADCRADRRRRKSSAPTPSARRGRRCSTSCSSSPSSSCGRRASSASAARSRSVAEDLRARDRLLRRRRPGAARRGRRVSSSTRWCSSSSGDAPRRMEHRRRLRRADLARPFRVLRPGGLCGRALRRALEHLAVGTASRSERPMTAAGTIIGFLMNRLRGPYFVIATIAVSQVLLLGAARWRGFTAGSEGIPVPFRPGSGRSASPTSASGSGSSRPCLGCLSDTTDR